jgi:hypothetical protein
MTPLTVLPSRCRPCRRSELLYFRGSMAGRHAPQPTLRLHPRGYRRRALGQCGSLLLHYSELSPPTLCRSPGAPATILTCANLKPATEVGHVALVKCFHNSSMTDHVKPQYTTALFLQKVPRCPARPTCDLTSNRSIVGAIHMRLRRQMHA